MGLNGPHRVRPRLGAELALFAGVPQYGPTQCSAWGPSQGAAGDELHSHVRADNHVRTEPRASQDFDAAALSELADGTACPDCDTQWTRYEGSRRGHEPHGAAVALVHGHIEAARLIPKHQMRHHEPSTILSYRRSSTARLATDGVPFGGTPGLQ